MARDISPFVDQALKKLPKSLRRGLDIPCGSGRHVVLLSTFCTEVVAADMDVAVLQSPANTQFGALRVQLDADKKLPFQRAIFDVVVVVHPQSLTLLAAVPMTLRCGGHLILETFGAQGENWRSLPRPGEIKRRLSVDFDLIAYLERKVHVDPSAVIVKGVFRKK